MEEIIKQNTMTDKKVKEIIKHFIDFIGEENGFEEEAIDDAVDYVQSQLDNSSDPDPENERKKYIITLSGNGYTSIHRWLTENEANLVQSVANELNAANTNVGTEELYIYPD